MACGTAAHIKAVHQNSLNIMQFSYWETQSTIMLIIFGDFLIVEQIFLSSQVKRIVIISNKLVHIRVASQVADRFKKYQT